MGKNRNAVRSSSGWSPGKYLSLFSDCGERLCVRLICAVAKNHVSLRITKKEVNIIHCQKEPYR